VFDNLIVSNPKDKKLTRGVPGSILSLVVHGVVIYAAVVATMRADDIIEEVFTDTTMVFLTEEQEPEPEPEPEQQEQQLVSLDPPPRGFQTVDAPIDIPSDFSGVGQEGGVFSGVEGGTGPVDLTQTFMEAAVDEPPERLSGPSPRYPEMLRQAGIEGSVVLEFVIDTTGRVEESSIKINQSTNRAFEGPARDVIRRSLYRPGRVRGQAVRVLVQQSISFSIQRD
jgi:protein TonB